MKKLLFLIMAIGIVAVVGRTLFVATVPSGEGRTGAGGATGRGSADSSERQFISAVSSSSEPEGMVFHVRPSRAGRLADRSELDTAWDQAVARGVPDQAGLRQQFLCHPLSIVARGKPTWDLETWRPTVGGLRTMLAACNPR